MNEIEFPPGICGELAKEILKNTIYKHPRFAIATALSIIATVAQRYYRSPDGGGVLGSYYFLITRIGGGKSEYIAEFRRIIELIDKNLLINDQWSDELTQQGCSENPAKTLLLDDGARWLKSVLNSKNKSFQRLNSELLKIWENGQYNGLSMLGADSDERYKKLLKLASRLPFDGLFSCIDFVIEPTIKPETFVVNNNSAMPEHIIETIKKVAKPKPWIFIDWETAEKAWENFAQQCSEQAKEKNSFASVNIAEKVLRTACLLSVFANRNQPVVSSNEMQWAIAWHKSLVSE